MVPQPPEHAEKYGSPTPRADAELIPFPQHTLARLGGCPPYHGIYNLLPVSLSVKYFMQNSAFDCIFKPSGYDSRRTK